MISGRNHHPTHPGLRLTGYHICPLYPSKQGKIAPSVSTPSGTGPSRMQRVFLISLGITTLPNSSVRLPIPVTRNYTRLLDAFSQRFFMERRLCQKREREDLGRKREEGNKKHAILCRLNDCMMLCSMKKTCSSSLYIALSSRKHFAMEPSKQHACCCRMKHQPNQFWTATIKKTSRGDVMSPRLFCFWRSICLNRFDPMHTYTSHRNVYSGLL